MIHIRTAKPRPMYKGFTLIELLVTIAIVGILAAIVVPTYKGSVQRIARSDALKSIDIVIMRLELCYKEHFTYVYDANNAPTCPDSTVNIDSIDNMYDIDIGDPADPTSTTAKPTTTTYNVVATRKNTGWSSDDSTCYKMSKNHLGVRSSENKSGTSNTQACWPHASGS